MGRYAYGGDDWMGGSVVDNDREEARDAARRPLPQHRGCPPDCRCTDCVWAELTPEERATVTRGGLRP